MPKQIAGLLIAATIAGAMLTTAAPARAEVFHPWCAYYTGFGGGGNNCGFASFAQCMAAISGAGGNCYENPAGLRAAPAKHRYRKSYRKHRH